MEAKRGPGRPLKDGARTAGGRLSRAKAKFAPRAKSAIEALGIEGEHRRDLAFFDREYFHAKAALETSTLRAMDHATAVEPKAVGGLVKTPDSMIGKIPAPIEAMFKDLNALGHLKALTLALDGKTSPGLIDALNAVRPYRRTLESKDGQHVSIRRAKLFWQIPEDHRVSEDAAIRALASVIGVGEDKAVAGWRYQTKVRTNPGILFGDDPAKTKRITYGAGIETISKMVEWCLLAQLSNAQRIAMNIHYGGDDTLFPSSAKNIVARDHRVGGDEVGLKPCPVFDPAQAPERAFYDFFRRNRKRKEMLEKDYIGNAKASTALEFALFGETYDQRGLRNDWLHWPYDGQPKHKAGPFDHCRFGVAVRSDGALCRFIEQDQKIDLPNGCSAQAVSRMIFGNTTLFTLSHYEPDNGSVRTASVQIGQLRPIAEWIIGRGPRPDLPDGTDAWTQKHRTKRD